MMEGPGPLKAFFGGIKIRSVLLHYLYLPIL